MISTIELFERINNGERLTVQYTGSLSIRAFEDYVGSDGWRDPMNINNGDILRNIREFTKNRRGEYCMSLENSFGYCMMVIPNVEKEIWLIVVEPTIQPTQISLPAPEQQKE